MTVIRKLFISDFKRRSRTVEINENLNLDMDEEGNLIGIEILSPEDYPVVKILKPVAEEYTEKDAEIVEIKKEHANI